MHYRTMGKLGCRVSALGFGAMHLPSVSFEQANKTLHYALDRGINYIDTAAAYRNSEEIIGKSIANRRDEYVLATKTNKRTYAEAKAEIERSLQLLQTDYVDLLQIHYVNYVTEFEQAMEENGAYRAALEAKQAGKVRFIGLTGHRPELLAKWISSGAFDQVLFHLNLAQPFALEQLVPEMIAQQMGRVAMKPLSGGFIQPVERAIRYPFSQDVHVVLSGMSSIEEVDQNIAALEQEMEADERAQLEQMASQLSTHNCRRCNYCSCPLGIPIPDVMISSVVRRELGLLPKGDGFYDKHREKLLACADYEPCKETPLCQPKCPYHLPMQQVIQGTAATLA